MHEQSLMYLQQMQFSLGDLHLTHVKTLQGRIGSVLLLQAARLQGNSDNRRE